MGPPFAGRDEVRAHRGIRSTTSTGFCSRLMRFRVLARNLLDPRENRAFTFSQDFRGTKNSAKGTAIWSRSVNQIDIRYNSTETDDEKLQSCIVSFRVLSEKPNWQFHTEKVEREEEKYIPEQKVSSRAIKDFFPRFYESICNHFRRYWCNTF